MFNFLSLFLSKSSSSVRPPLVQIRNLFMEFNGTKRRSTRSSSTLSPYFSQSLKVEVKAKRQLSTEDIASGDGRSCRKPKKSKRKSSTSTISITSESRAGASPFSSKTILQAVEDYSSEVVVKEFEKKEQTKYQPCIESIRSLGDSEEITDPLDTADFVFFDLETGGLSPAYADILEIAAITNDGLLFSSYVKPKKKINPFASKVNHITYKNGDLMFKGKTVHSKSLYDALHEFLEWLKNVGGGKKVTLVAHNSNFDSRFLVHYLAQQGLEITFLKVVSGFLDTIPMFRKIHPGLTNYKQDFLVSKFLTKKHDYDAHSAVSDVKYLRLLFQQQLAHKITDFFDFSYSSSHALNKHLLGPKIDINVSTYKLLIRTKVMTKGIATKLSALDYRYDELVAVYKTKGSEALRTIFTQTDPKGRPRITASETVLTKIFDHFDKKYKN